MNWDMLGALAETAGAIGVIVSIVYLAAQIRHGTRETRRSNAHQLNQATRSWWAHFVGDEDAVRIWRIGLTEYSSLTADQALRFSAMVLELMTIMEELHYSRVDAHVPNWVGRLHQSGRREFVSMPGFKHWYEERGHWFSPEFRAILEVEMKREYEGVSAHFYQAEPDEDTS